MNTDKQQRRVANWYPVEPSLTHCAEIRSVALDLKAERTSEGLRDDDFDAMKFGDPWLWQKVVMKITAINAGEDPSSKLLFPVLITFFNVVMLHFQESEFGEGSAIDDVSNRVSEPVYHNEDLTKEAGFLMTEQTTSSGAFCLWVCDESPVVDQVIDGWKPWIDSEEKNRVFRHYRLSSDDLGEFNIVCTRTVVERTG